MRLPLATKAAKGRSIPLTAELLVNMYAERAPSGAKSDVVVHGCPGYTLFSNISTDKPRGLHKTISDGKVYAVIGQSLYSIDSSGLSTSLGTIASSGLVSMASSATELCIVAGSTAYTYNATEGLEKIVDSDFPGATTVTFIDGFFVFNNRQNGQKDQFFISNLDDGEVYDALDFATAERYPDNLVRVFADHSELILFGTDSIEIWFNSGAADFPFARAQGSVIEQGLGATYSVQKVDESVLWLDNEGIVRRLEGSTPLRISDHAIEYQISLGDWENAFSWTYVQEGHQFYVLTIPAASTSQTAGTYVFDAATQLWHKRKSYETDFYRLGFYVRAFGKHLAMDTEVGKLYELSMNDYEEDGNHLISEIHFPQVQNDGLRFIVHKFQLDMEVGSTNLDQNIPTPPDKEIILVGANNSLGVGTVESGVNESSSKPSGAGYSGDLTSVTYSRSLRRLVAASSINQGDVIYSDDFGVTWVLSSTDISGGNLSGNSGRSGIAWSPKLKLFAVLLNQGWATSPDGKTWSFTSWTGNLLNSGSGKGWDDLIWDYTNDIFIGCGQFGPGGCIVTSTDGETWVQRSHGVASTEALYVIEHAPGLSGPNGTTIIMNNGGSPENIHYSTNGGTSWAQQTDTTIVQDINDVSWSPQLIRFVAVNDTRVVYYSSDGKNWDATGNVLPSGGTWQSIEWFDRYSVYITTNSDGRIYKSSTGISGWSQITENATADDWRGLYVFNLSDAISPLAAASSSDPSVMLRESSDTRTTGFTEPTRSMGKKGEYSKRVIWRRRGQHRSYTPIVKISEPVKRAIFTAYVEIEPCAG